MNPLPLHHRICFVPLLSLVLLAIGVTVPSKAATFLLTSSIDGAQANAGAGTGSPGTGSATVNYNDATGLLSWDISWSGLTGSETAMHFHGPAALDQNAGVQVNFGSISGLTSPSIGSTTITGAQATDLLADNWYINIHSTNDPGGEIRGQVLQIPELGVSALCAAAVLLGLVGTRRRG